MTDKELITQAFDALDELIKRWEKELVLPLKVQSPRFAGLISARDYLFNALNNETFSNKISLSEARRIALANSKRFDRLLNYEAELDARGKAIWEEDDDD